MYDNIALMMSYLYEHDVIKYEAITMRGDENIPMIMHVSMILTSHNTSFETSYNMASLPHITKISP